MHSGSSSHGSAGVELIVLEKCTLQWWSRHKAVVRKPNIAALLRATALLAGRAVTGSMRWLSSLNRAATAQLREILAVRGLDGTVS